MHKAAVAKAQKKEEEAGLRGRLRSGEMSNSMHKAAVAKAQKKEEEADLSPLSKKDSDSSTEASTKSLTKKLLSQQEFQVIETYLRNFSMRAAGVELDLGKNVIWSILHRPHVRKAMQLLLVEEDVTVPMVRKELRKLAFYDPREFFSDDGALLPISEMSEEVAAAISSIEINELFEGSGIDRRHVGYVKKIKLADRGINLERLGKYLKMFTDKHELSGPNGTPLMAPPAIIVKFGAGE